MTKEKKINTKCNCPKYRFLVQFKHSSELWEHIIEEYPTITGYNPSKFCPNCDRLLTQEELEQYNVQELKSMCVTLKERVSGNKPELIDRVIGKIFATNSVAIANKPNFNLINKELVENFSRDQLVQMAVYHELAKSGTKSEIVDRLINMMYRSTLVYWMERQEELRQERLMRERAEQERFQQERLMRERAEHERLQQERLMRERAEQERLMRERAEQERLQQERLMRERAEHERLQQERLMRERAEQERLMRERAEQERLQQERLETERAEQERLQQERLETERAEQERLKQERLERERAEQERFEQERLERIMEKSMPRPNTLYSSDSKFISDMDQMTDQIDRLSFSERYRIGKPSSPSPETIRSCKPLRSTIKEAVWNEWCGSESKKGKCFYCLRTIDDKNWHAGHILSRHHGGTDEVGNIRPLCSNCNLSTGKGHMYECMLDEGAKGCINIKLNDPDAVKYYNWIRLVQRVKTILSQKLGRKEITPEYYDDFTTYILDQKYTLSERRKILKQVCRDNDIDIWGILLK